MRRSDKVHPLQSGINQAEPSTNRLRWINGKQLEQKASKRLLWHIFNTLTKILHPYDAEKKNLHMCNVLNTVTLFISHGKASLCGKKKTEHL